MRKRVLKKKKSLKNSQLFMFTLLVIGVVLICYPQLIRSYHNYKNKQNYVDYEKRVLNKTEQELDDYFNKVTTCYEKNKTSDFSDPFNTNETTVDCLPTEKNDVFGVLEIPVLDIVIPIYLNSNSESLENGVGLVKGASLPVGGENTHTVLAGHRGMWNQEMLRHAERIKEAEFFYIHTMGKTLTYQVFAQTIIEPSDTSILNIVSNKDLATLITCHPFPTDKQRLLIRAERVL